jgi:hypothetical protein
MMRTGRAGNLCALAIRDTRAVDVSGGCTQQHEENQLCHDTSP